MEKHPWEKAWEDGKFKIITFQPSVLVERYKNALSVNDSVLDIGCGNGRNAIYVANLGCNVDCLDIADTKFTEQLDPELKSKINFTKSDALVYSYPDEKYKAVIMSRILQYLNVKDLMELFKKISISLKPDGFLLVSFTTEGGIFNREDINVPKYKHTIEEIEGMLKNMFNNVTVTEGSKQTKGVNYKAEIKSYDIYAENPYK